MKPRYKMYVYGIFVVLFVVNAEPIYRNSLRHLPEKLKQERIKKSVEATFQIIQDQIIRVASANYTETNFTLFCNEPNKIQKNMEQQSIYPFQNSGASYRISRQEELRNRPTLVYPKPKCSVKDGYELYSNPPTLYRIPIYNYEKKLPLLEDDPHIYIQYFFQKLNMQFPDLSLQISHERNSDGIFENDCCPVYIVSW